MQRIAGIAQAVRLTTCTLCELGASIVPNRPVSGEISMNANLTCGLTVALCAAVLAQAPAEQTLDRVLKVTRTDSAQELQEMGTVIRSVGEIRQLVVDPLQRT